MLAQLLFLGTGGSLGIPMVGCSCDVCKSPLKKNKRLRSSALINLGGKNILIDAGPDLRYQLLANGIQSLDGLILTHAHNDHTAGIDDLRAIFIERKVPLPCLMSQDTLDELKKRFDYIFTHPEKAYYLKTLLDTSIVPNERGQIQFMNFDIGYVTYEQAGMNVNGFRLGDLAYITDIKHFPHTIFDDLQGINTLVISALRFTSSHMHLSVDEAIDFAARVGAKQTYFTHISHDLDHQQASSYLPETIHLAYDGLKIDFFFANN